MAGRTFLDSVHPVYRDSCAEWLRNERRLYGGDAATAELRRFDWEKIDSPHYWTRREAATYIPLPDMLLSTLVGHLERAMPEPDYGTLGTVAQRGGASPSLAQLVHYNVDGRGSQGSAWRPWWSHQAKLSGATGHRWMMAEGPAVAPQSRRDEIRGQRPYLVGFSPLQVTNWHYDDAGHLQFAIVRVPFRSPRLADTGELVGNDVEMGYYLMTAAGFSGFGREFANGGWWRFRPDREPLMQAGRQLAGTWGWDATDARGQIPLWPVYYQRADGLLDVPAGMESLVAGAYGATPAGVGRSGAYAGEYTAARWGARRGRAAMSRSAITELGNLAVAYMNLDSAADFDAWDAAMSVLFLLGVDPEGHNIVVDKYEEGSRIIPLQRNGMTGEQPTVADSSAGAVAADVFAGALERKLQNAALQAALEATGDPNTSGASKEATWQGQVAPRLSTWAGNVESAQLNALFYLELRGGSRAPSGTVRWPDTFHVRELTDAIEEMFSLENLTRLRSPTLGSRMMLLAGQRRGLVPDDLAKTVEAEYRDAAGGVAEADAAAARMNGALGGALNG